MLSAVKEIIQYKELLFTLVGKDIQSRYKQTLLGIFWRILPPVATMLIFTFVTKAQILRIDTGNIPYPIFAYCGLLPWSFFAGSLGAATGSLVGNANLITKVYFPREILPLSAILSKFVDLCIASVVLVGLMIFYHFDWHITILAVPLVLLIQVIFAAGLSFLLSMGNLFYRDIGFGLGIGLQIWMFATSVVYPIKTSFPRLQNILMLNPMTPVINSYRDLILKGVWTDISTLIMPICVSVGVFIIGLICFHKTEHLFAENI